MASQIFTQTLSSKLDSFLWCKKNNGAFIYRLLGTLIENELKSRCAALAFWFENQECFVDTHTISCLSINGNILSSK